ncbi:MAG: metallophosphoesterase [Planctomycetota bacterium]
MGSWTLQVRTVGALAWRRVAGEEPPTGRRQHYRIEGLEPETRYEYRLLDPSDHILASGELTTAPREGTGRVRFGVLGDSGDLPWWNYSAFSSGFDLAGWAKDLMPGRGSQWRVIERICEWDADLVLHLGDLVYPWGRRQDFPEAFLLPFGRFLASHPVYPTIGNHDLMSEAGAPFDDHFVLPVPPGAGARRYYAFVHGPVQFICLDAFSHADPLSPGSDQWRWLRRTLDAAAPTWRVVYLHRPLWSTSNTARDDIATALRRELHPLLARARVDLVLSGPDHLYQRFEPKDGVTYVIEGAGGRAYARWGGPRTSSRPTTSTSAASWPRRTPRR